MSDKPTIDQPVDQVRLLMEEFTRSGIATLHLRSGGFELLLSNDSAAPSLSAGGQSAPAPLAPAPVAAAVSVTAPVAAAPVAASPASVPDGAIVISAPNLGTFYRSPKPGSPAYVEIGGRVGADDEICLIEVMKLFTAVKAGTAGTIVAVLAEDGAMVEAGQPLFALLAD